MEPLSVELPPVARRILQSMADAGILGETDAEIAAYLILRELDDLTRCGVLKLGHSEAKSE